MKEKFRHIAALLMMLVFLTYAVGLEVSKHICVKHGSQTTSLFSEAECPCHHLHAHSDRCGGGANTSTESCGDSHHSHSASYPEFADDCCVQIDNSFAIEDAFSPVGYESLNHYFTVLYFVPIEDYMHTTIPENTEILNLSCDDANPARRNIIQFLIHNSNPNKSDDISFPLA